MPRYTWNTQADWDAMYSFKAGDAPGVIVGTNRVVRLIKQFPIQKMDHIIVIGCGMGFLIDAFNDAGYRNCWGIDTSPIYPRTSPVQTAKWIISENVLESYYDDEMDALLDEWEALGENIIHMVMTNHDLHPVFNAKTLDEWKAIRPNHSWMEVG